MVKTIIIDKSKCDGCGLCVEACHEGALALVDGKAELVRPNFCDGMGDCLPACPRDAIAFKDESPASGTSVPMMPSIPIRQEFDQTPGTQWPIQLGLVSPASEFLKGTLIIASDCSAFKINSIKESVIKENPLVIGCPKLDDRSRFDKLLTIFSNRPISDVVVVRMEVPCCSALTRITESAIKESGKDIGLTEIVIRKDGQAI
jgi:NAD-dependent dihydropyrimidine dehydrogenase PreA subunit